MVKRSGPNPTTRMVIFVCLLLILTGGLVMVWKELPWAQVSLTSALPHQDESTTDQATSSQRALDRTSCEASRGHWIDCGSPCHGQHAENCIQACEPQCLCGGIAGWQCPTTYTCTDYEPSAQTPDALGVCRDTSQGTPVTKTVTTTTHVISPGKICDDAGSICIDASYQNRLLENPVMVTGTVTGLQSDFSWKLVDAHQEILQEGAVLLSSITQGNVFTLGNDFEQLPRTTTGTLTLFTSEQEKVVSQLNIPVRLPKLTWRQIKLFYLPEKTADTRCATVRSVSSRIPSTLTPMQASLAHFLRIDSSEIPAGFMSRIPDRTSIVSFSLKQGVATVELDAGFDRNILTECAAQGVRAQIESVLKQFSGVKKVEIKLGDHVL